jgi:hypothetical protein
MKTCKNFSEIEEIFSQYDTKHLPVVDRMVVDINRRLLKEKSKSLMSTNKPFSELQPQSPQYTKKTLYKQLTHSYSDNDLNPKKCYTYLGEFYIRLKQDIEKRRVRSRIRQQIKKILDKKREDLPSNKRKGKTMPHLPHRFESEQKEIEKMYGLPGRPVNYACAARGNENTKRMFYY